MVIANLNSNTDRLLAIWQALNPASYVTNQTNMLATFTTPPNSWADDNTRKREVPRLGLTKI